MIEARLTRFGSGYFVSHVRRTAADWNLVQEDSVVDSFAAGRTVVGLHRGVADDVGIAGTSMRRHGIATGSDIRQASSLVDVRVVRGDVGEVGDAAAE